MPENSTLTIGDFEVLCRTDRDGTHHHTIVCAPDHAEFATNIFLGKVEGVVLDGDRIVVRAENDSVVYKIVNHDEVRKVYTCVRES